MVNAFTKFIGAGLEFFFEYETVKVVHISSIKLGVVNRLLQFLLLAFIIGYVIIYEKGYQTFDTPISSVTTKVKGIGYANISGNSRVFDVPDFVVPPQMKDSFFVMTNAVITPIQNQSVCPENPDVPGVNCTEDTSICQQGFHDMLGNGVQTGNCVPSKIAGTKVCEIQAWCPVEDDDAPDTPLFSEAENFTVLIKNNVRFPMYKIRRRNILETQNSSFLRGCQYDANDSDLKLCPIFRLGTIFDLAGVDFKEAAATGAVVSITIVWNCDFDYSEKECIPEYQFSRIDTPDAKISPGFNFRYSDNWKNENGIDYRTLYKAYGVLFVVQVRGKGGKFDLIPLATNLGSGLALLAIVSVICDILLLYCVKMRDVYRQKKYLFVKGDDAFSSAILDRSDSDSIAEGNYQSLHNDIGEGGSDEPCPRDSSLVKRNQNKNESGVEHSGSMEGDPGVAYGNL